MWLDADDVLSEKNRKSFVRLKESILGNADVVMMKYETAFDEAGNPVFSYYRERLLRRELNFHSGRKSSRGDISFGTNCLLRRRRNSSLGKKRVRGQKFTHL